MIGRLRLRPEGQFFGALSSAAPGLATAWWLAIVARGVGPAAFMMATGALIGAVQRHEPLSGALTFAGGVLVALQVLGPLHGAVSANLGDRTAAWLYDRLTHACIDPPGLRHLEDDELSTDLTVARDFDLGMTGPPLNVSMDFIAGGLVEMIAGLACAALLGGYAWWAPLVIGSAWLSTHWWLRESAVWRDRETAEVRAAQRDAEYAYRLAVDPGPSKEIRLFGLAEWTVDRFVARRTRLHALQHTATRLRERPLALSAAVVTLANLVLCVSLARSVSSGALGFDALIVYAQAAFGASMIAFGGLSWALDGATAPVAAVTRVGPAMASRGALTDGHRDAATLPRQAIQLRNVTFTYPDGPPVLQGVTLTIRAGTSLAIVGQNGAGKTTLAKLLCRFYDPDSGTIEVDGVDLRDCSLQSWRRRVTAVFQDFTRFERSLRDNVAPSGAPDAVIEEALAAAGADHLASLDTVLNRGYAGGTDLSGGQWQRVALARALCAVRLGADVVLLDEPTAQLDVRGEAEIFQRVLAATAGRTTILISHRFSTVRQADCICVLEHGRVVELGAHDELMALGGRYKAMFDAQAQRFADDATNATSATDGALGADAPDQIYDRLD